MQPLVDARREAGLTDMTVVTYPDARHEILNETSSAEVIGSVTDWAKRVTAAR